MREETWREIRRGWGSGGRLPSGLGICVWLDVPLSGEKNLQFLRKARERDHASEVFFGQLADFAFVIRQWFWV